MRRILLWFSAVLVLAALAALVLISAMPLFSSKPADAQPAADVGPPYRLRDHFYRHGIAESGALNLVAAIYLGYRAFDTLGETIVLIVSVAGVILFTGAK